MESIIEKLEESGKVLFNSKLGGVVEISLNSQGDYEVNAYESEKARELFDSLEGEVFSGEAYEVVEKYYYFSPLDTEVYWSDPEEGISSGVYKVFDWGEEMIGITNQYSEAFVLPHELSLVK